MIAKKSSLLGLCMCFLASLVMAEQSEPEAIVTEKVPTKVPLKTLREFAETFTRIKQNYVEPVSDKKLIEDAMKGMVGGLDPHSAYLDMEAYRDLKIGTRGEFGGLGIEVSKEDGLITIIAPMDDTPAEKAGLKSGDTIVRIDGKPLRSMTLNEAVSLMRGKVGSKIELTIHRKGKSDLFNVTIERAIIKMKSVRSKLLDDSYGYIRISQFQSRTSQDMLEKISELKEQAKGQLKGLILDLRNNPGGVLNGAVSVSDAFLRKGKIVYTKGRAADSRLTFKASPGDVLKGAPLVVLVNGGSASASEIVAGALQDHRRAIIIGEKTFGKGSVQTIVPINETVGIKLTTARYYTPNGRSIQAEGIVPDILLQDAMLESKKKQKVSRITEADLSGHLDNDSDYHSDKKKSEKTLEKDFQLAEALNILKGLSLYQQARTD